MLAMHYAIDLPADYDMEIIRRRVRDNGAKTDGFRDLEMKAYLIAEKGKYGNTGNQYAPFYVWRDVQGMNDFLLHGPFDNILHSFGRPPVHIWLVVQAHISKALSGGIACVDISHMPLSANPGALIKEETEAARCLGTAMSLVTAYTPYSWELCRFSMGPGGEIPERSSSHGLVYDVHHIS